MPKDIVFPESLFKAIDETHAAATAESNNLCVEAKGLADRRNENNAEKNKNSTPSPVAKSGSKLSI